MLTIIEYQCEICEKRSANAEEIRKCEAQHYGLTVEKLNEWHYLQHDVKRKACNVSICKTEKTEREFDEATELLLAFEKKHGLTKPFLKRVMK